MQKLPASLALLAFGFAISACGAEVEPAPAPQSPASSNSSSGGPQQNPPSTTSPDPSGDGTKGTQTTSTAGPLVQLKNTSSAARWIVIDSQETPVDFEVGVPALQLNAYGSYWCGGPQDLHNDPFAHVMKIEPGVVTDIYWHAISVTREGDCWEGTPLAPGSYPTKACFYESEPEAIYNPGTKSKTVPLTCADVTLTIPASGAAELDF
jgi:hypothetical protein